MAVSVLLLSNDPHLGSSLQALASGLLRVRNLEPSRQPATWPGRAGSTVVLDLAAGERATAYSWVRQHHAGRLIVLLRPGEQASSLPPDPDRLVLRRPLSLSDLVEILSGLDSTNGSADEIPSRRVRPPPPGQKPAEGDLLRASAKQRGLRLGSLSSPAGPAPTAPPGPPVAGGRLGQGNASAAC